MTIHAPNPTVLVADDDPDVLQLVSTCFAREGWEVVEARDGHEALALISERLPQLAILDLVMPNMYGYTIVRHMRAHEDTKRIPVILLTAQTSDQDVERGFEVGADDYVKKPFGTKELLARARALLNGRVRAA